jgi:RNA polymerase sigma factor (sigma-70 family)
MHAAPQTVLDYLSQFLGEQRLGERSDAELLDHFVAHRDDASFAVLVRRHGPMVLGLCRRFLGQRQDAEDAFQATFLVLARRAGSLRKRPSLAAWLHGVAYRIACKARTAAARRRRHERQAGLARPEQPAEDVGQLESFALFDEELARLPERFREPLILCYLDGLTHEETARRLSLRPRTLKARLERGRALLRKALERRGMAGSTIAGLFASPAGTTLPAVLAGSAVRHAALFATRSAAAEEIPASVLALAHNALSTVLLPRVSVALLVLLVLAGLVLGMGLASPPRVEVHKAAPPIRPAEEVRPMVDRHGDPLPEGALARLGTVRLRQGKGIYHIALSRDGKLLATGGQEGAVRLWDTRTGQPICEFVDRGFIMAVGLSPDARLIAWANSLTEVRVAEVRTGKELFVLPSLKSCVSLAFSPDGKLLAEGGRDGTRVWSLSDRAKLLQLPAGASGFRTLSFSANGKRLSTAAEAQPPRVYDTTTGQECARFAGRKSPIHCTALSPDGTRLAIGYEDGFLCLGNTTTGKIERNLPGHRNRGAVTSLAFTGDGKTLFSTGRGDPLIRQWDVKAGKLIGTIPIEIHDGMNVAVSADGKTLAVGGDNCTARIWHAMPGGGNTPAWKELVLPEAHHSQVMHLAFSPDGKTLASAGYRGPAQLWDVSSARRIAVRGGKTDSVYTLGYAPDGQSLVLSEKDHRVRWCHPRTGAVERSLPWKSASYPMAIGFRNGTTLVAGYSERNLYLEEMHPLPVARPLQGEKHFVSQIRFGPSGRTLVSSSSTDKSILLWDSATGKQTRKIGGVQAAWSLALSPDDKYLAAGEGAIMHVWELATGKEVVQQRDHPHRITSLTFSRDGRWLASSCADCTLRVFETASWQTAALFKGHMSEAKGLAFSPDCRLLASGGDDTSILLWDLTDRFAKERLPPLSRRQLDTLWEELAEDAEKGRRALWALARSPKESVTYLRGRLAAKPVDPKRLDRLIAELDDDAFALRDRATKELQSLGEAAGPAMRQALAKTTSLEVKTRLRRCLELLQPAKAERQRLQRLRALAALEYAALTPATASAAQTTPAATRSPPTPAGPRTSGERRWQ